MLSESESSETECDTESDDNEFYPYSSIQIKKSDIVRSVAINDNVKKLIESKQNDDVYDFLDETVYREFENSCCWSFSACKIVNGELAAHAKCSEAKCKSKLYLHTQDEKSKLNFVVQSFDTTLVDQHSKKRPVKGSRRVRIERDHGGQSALQIQADLVGECVTSEKPTFLPARIPNISTIRQIGHKKKSKRTFAKDTYESLTKMKYDPNFKNCIQEIGLNPFFVLYSTIGQQEYIRIELNKRKYLTLSIDATGVAVKPPTLSAVSDKTGKKKKNFLYMICVNGKVKTIPVYQLITQDHTATSIMGMMNKFKFKTGYLPNEIIMDGSKALLAASVQSFCLIETTNEYISQCIDYLVYKTGNLPKVFIRMDRSHFIKNLHRASKLRKIDPRTRKLLLCTIGFIIQSLNHEVVFGAITDLFVIIQSTYVTSFASESLAKLQKLCTDFDESIYLEEVEEGANDDIDDDESHEIVKSLKTTSAYKWIFNGYENAAADVRNNKEKATFENVYYIENQDIHDYLIELFATIPLWSNIMVDSFQSPNCTATSSGLESQFKNLKSLILTNKSNIRADLFVRHHVEFLRNHLKIQLPLNNSTTAIGAVEPTDKRNEIDECGAYFTIII